MTDLSRRLREPLPLVLLVLAVAGWIAFVAMWINAGLSDRQQQGTLALLTSERDQLSATLAERDRTHGQIAQANAKLLDVEQQLGSVSTAFTAASTELEARQNELAQAVTHLEDTKSATQGLIEQADAAKQLLNEAASRQASIQAETESASRQLSEVDTRLTEARRQEETATTNVAQMAQEVATNSATLADLQSELQSSRTELLEAQDRLAQAKLATETANTAAQEAQAKLADLTQAKTTLETQVAAYSEQITMLQPQVEELTRNLTQRSTALQSVETNIAQAIAPSLNGTTYETQSGLKLTLLDTGSFTLSDSLNRQVSGRFVMAEGELTLSEASGRLGAAQFPMTCPYSETEDGFTLGQAEGCVLSDLTFTRADPL
ncbi:hypothetical protein JHC09_10345 [Devosia sp. MC532]|uniref:hypothetical protein n=1 Tax=Devosia sp. MC532 TaxID=2799788 RepID=UPI0018F6E011|nr:hypothetical protein [Devosia sp. MC532]MBJ7578283.1 hypothetical protein [Devosia sp. MC532]